MLSLAQCPLLPSHWAIGLTLTTTALLPNAMALAFCLLRLCCPSQPPLELDNELRLVTRLSLNWGIGPLAQRDEPRVISYHDALMMTGNFREAGARGRVQL